MRVGRHRRFALLVSSLYGAALLTSCGGTAPAGGGNPVSGGQPISPMPSVPQHSFVVMVVEENHAYEQVIGSASMPYLNTLAQQGALATQYYADAHPSIGNYFALTTGALQ